MELRKLMKYLLSSGQFWYLSAIISLGLCLVLKATADSMAEQVSPLKTETTRNRRSRQRILAFCRIFDILYLLEVNCALERIKEKWREGKVRKGNQLLLGIIIQIRMSNKVGTIPRKKNYFTKSQAILPVLHPKEEFVAIIQMKKQYQSLIKKELELLSQFENEEVREQNEWEAKIERKEAVIMPFVLSQPERVRRETKGEEELRQCFQLLRKENMGKYFKRAAEKLQWIKKEGIKQRAVKFFFEEKAQNKYFKAWRELIKKQVADINSRGILHYQSKIFPKYFASWRSHTVKVIADNQKKSKAHYWKILTTNYLNRWKDNVNAKETERLQRGLSHYNEQLLFKFFNDWAYNVNEIVTQQKDEANVYYRNRMLRKCFDYWEQNSRKARQQRQENERIELSRIKQQQSKLLLQLQSKEFALRKREEEILERQRSIRTMESQIIVTKNEVINQIRLKQTEQQLHRSAEIERKKIELLQWEKLMQERQREVRHRQAEITMKHNKINQLSKEQQARLQDIELKRIELENMQKYTQQKIKELQDRQQAITLKDKEIEEKRKALQDQRQQEIKRQLANAQKIEEQQNKARQAHIELYNSQKSDNEGFEDKYSRQEYKEDVNEESQESSIKQRQQYSQQSHSLEQYKSDEKIELASENSYQKVQEIDADNSDNPQPFIGTPSKQSQQQQQSDYQIYSQPPNEQEQQLPVDEQLQITPDKVPQIPEIAQLLQQPQQVNPQFLKYLFDKPDESQSDPQDEEDIQSFQMQLYSKLFIGRLRDLKQSRRQYERSSQIHRSNILEKAFLQWKNNVLFERDLQIDNNVSFENCQTQVKTNFLKRVVQSLRRQYEKAETKRSNEDRTLNVKEKIKQIYFSKFRKGLKINFETQKQIKIKQNKVKNLLFKRFIGGIKRVDESRAIDQQQLKLAKAGVNRIYFQRLLSSMKKEAAYAKRTRSLRIYVINSHFQSMITSFGKFQQSSIRKEEQETKLRYCLARYDKNLMKRVFKAIHMTSRMRHLQELKIKCFKGLKMYTMQKKMLRKCLEIEQQSEQKGYSYYPTTEEQHKHFQQLLGDDQ